MKYTYHGPMHAITIRNPSAPDDKPEDALFEGNLYPGCSVDLPDTLPLVINWAARGWLIPQPAPAQAAPNAPVNAPAANVQPAPQAAPAGNNP